MKVFGIAGHFGMGKTTLSAPLAASENGLKPSLVRR